MKNEIIELGDKVKCIYTGFTGVTVAKIEFINGCVQFSVQPKVDKDGKYPEEMNIDNSSLIIIKKNKVKKVFKEEKEESGGRSTVSSRMRGY